MEKRLKLSLKRIKVSKKVDSYACAIRVKEEYFKRWKTVGHIPREISRHIHYFTKTERNFIKSTKFRSSQMPAGGPATRRPL